MNNLLKFLFGYNFCRHTKLNLDMKFQYCPDCGELIELSWYVVRCSCCDLKREPKLRLCEIVPKDNFCTNCGCEDFYIQKVDNLRFYDIPHAILVKESIENSPSKKYTQIWADSCESAHIHVLKLLPILTEHKSVS